MTGDIPAIAGAALLGVLLGLAFFWGLWLTVDGLDRSRRPAVRMFVSLVLRFSAALAVFYLLAKYAGWPHLIAAALGFALARLLTVQRSARRRAERGFRQ
jgi:F1F0 ATPase subunit 2